MNLWRASMNTQTKSNAVATTTTTTTTSKKRKQSGEARPYKRRDNGNGGGKRWQPQPSWQPYRFPSTLKTDVESRKSDSVMRDLIARRTTPKPVTIATITAGSTVSTPTATTTTIPTTPPSTTTTTTNTRFIPNRCWLYDSSVLHWAQECYDTLRCGAANLTVRPCFVACGADGSGKAALVKEIIGQCVHNGIIPNTLPYRPVHFDPSEYDSLAVKRLVLEFSVLYEEMLRFKHVRRPPITRNNADWKYAAFGGKSYYGRTTSVVEKSKLSHAAILFVRDIDLIYDCCASIYSVAEMQELHESLSILLKHADNRIITFITCTSTASWYVRDLLRNVVKPTHWLRTVPLPSLSDRVRWLARLSDESNRTHCLTWLRGIARRLGITMIPDVVAYFGTNAGEKLFRQYADGATTIAVEFGGCTVPSSVSQWVCQLGWLATGATADEYPIWLLSPQRHHDYAGKDNSNRTNVGTEDVVFNYSPMFSHHALKPLRLTKSGGGGGGGGNLTVTATRDRWWESVLAHMQLRSVLAQFSYGVWRRAAETRPHRVIIVTCNVDESKPREKRSSSTIVYRDNRHGMLSAFCDTLAAADIIVTGFWREPDMAHGYIAPMVDCTLGAFAEKDVRPAPLSWYEERLPRHHRPRTLREMDTQWGQTLVVETR